MNVRLLRRIQKVILEEPKRVNMDSYASHPEFIAERSLPACRTVACIAGWSHALTANLRAERLADSSVGLTTGMGELQLSEDQAHRLFYEEAWPTKFYNELRGPWPGTPEYARIVASRIDHFIATKGAE